MSTLIKEIKINNSLGAIELIKSGVDIGYIDKKKNLSVLMIACENKLTNVALALINRKDCDVNVIDKGGNNALLTSCNDMNSEVALALINRKDCDVNVIDKDIETTAMIAWVNELYDVFFALIERKDCDVNVLDQTGDSLILACCRSGSEDNVKPLIERKDCNINVIDKEGNTPLMICCITNSIKIISELVKREDCNLNVTDKEGNTPLMICCLYNNIDIIIELIKRKDCNINVIDKEGNTPLMICCITNSIKIISELVKREDCNLNAINSDGHTALSLSCLYNNIDIIIELIKYGVKYEGEICSLDIIIRDKKIIGVNMNLFQVEFTRDTFKTLYDLGPTQCGAICLNTMGFNIDIVKELESTRDSIRWSDMKTYINKYLKYIKTNERERLHPNKINNRVKLNNYNITNSNFIYDIFSNNLEKRFCAIFGYCRSTKSGHYMVVAKSDSETIYMFDPQGRNSYRGKKEIIEYLNNENIIKITLYLGDIKLKPPTVLLQLEGNVYKPERMPTILSASPNVNYQMASALTNNNLEVPFSFGNTRASTKRFQNAIHKKKNSTRQSQRKHPKSSKRKPRKKTPQKSSKKKSQ